MTKHTLKSGVVTRVIATEKASIHREKLLLIYEAAVLHL